MNDTLPDVNLDPVLDSAPVQGEETPCSDCEMFTPRLVKPARWQLIMSAEACSCSPNPMPLCDLHKSDVDFYRRHYGDRMWQCHLCHNVSDVVDVVPLQQD